MTKSVVLPSYKVNRLCGQMDLDSSKVDADWIKREFNTMEMDKAEEVFPLLFMYIKYSRAMMIHERTALLKAAKMQVSRYDSIEGVVRY